MTETIEETIVTVDPDLDTADDDHRHLKHSICQPGPGPSIAHCGEPFIASGEKVVRVDPIFCRPCIEISLRGMCPNCGMPMTPLRIA